MNHQFGQKGGAMGGKMGCKGKAAFGGKGKQAAWAPPQQTIQQMEAVLSTTAWSIYESSLDLNIPAGKLAADWNAMLSTRGKILAMYGVGGGVTAPDGCAAAAGGTVAWKQLLGECLFKRGKKSLEKGSIAYQTSDVEGGYIGSVSAPGLLAQDYTSDEVGTNKKAAEAAAAKMAMQAEFPEQAEAASAGQQPVNARQQGTKRKAEQQGAQMTARKDPKSLLVHAAQLLIGDRLTREDVVYDTTVLGEGADKKYSSTLKLPRYNTTSSWTSGVMDSKKEAESAAASSALEFLAPIVEPLQKEKDEKKKEKNRQSLQELKNRPQKQQKVAGGQFTNEGLLS